MHNLLERLADWWICVPREFALRTYHNLFGEEVSIVAFRDSYWDRQLVKGHSPDKKCMDATHRRFDRTAKRYQ